jgi:hypothetical protein
MPSRHGISIYKKMGTIAASFSFLRKVERTMLVNKTATKTVSALIGLFLITFLISCGKKEVKPVSQESKLAQEAFQLAETLKDAYTKKDRETFLDNCTNDGYRELIAVIKKFDGAELTFTPTWVEIKDSSVYLSVSWKGVWTLGTKSREERGLAVFVLEGNPLKLAKVQRDNPFSQPE